MTMQQSAPLAERLEASRDRVGVDRFDLGVLLVHGLGQQQRGDTLTEAGDEIFRWLRLRVRDEQDGGGNVTVLDVTARAPSGDAIPAAHAVVRITPPDGAASTWVVAEAWWAEVFRPATFMEMAGWVVTVGPWVFATQVAGVRRRLEIGVDVPPALRVLLIPVTLVFGLLMAAAAAIIGFVVTALVAGIFLVAVTRIPVLAEAAQRLQRQMANEFGDAYVLTRSPVRFGAMSSAVRSDLQALREQCKSVVLIAHSQGTAVAWFALRHELTDGRVVPTGAPARSPIGLFLTYGQAVRKLTFALCMARGEQKGVRTILSFGSALLVGAAIAGYLLTGLWWVPTLLGILAVVAELFLLRSASEVWEKSGKELEEDWADVLKHAPDIEWLDLWASADPASVGPLDVEGPHIDSYKIRNLGSILGDHTTYWHNTTEFLAIVGGKLFGLGGPQTYAVPLTDRYLVVAAMRRHARVVLLTTMRFIVLGAIIAGLVWVVLTPTLGGEVIAWIDGLDLLFVDPFFADPPEWAVLVAGFVPVLVAGFLVWRVLEGLWKGLVGADEAIYFGTEQRSLWNARW
ncbi:MAG TPA: hypothetical protein VJ839_02145, partial [Candidatus Limnocylindria bacterium]|nr:hypothetical protein [Candidatus Limnocylindria bacterium]